jgi:hypothetical protein
MAEARLERGGIREPWGILGVKRYEEVGRDNRGALLKMTGGLGGQKMMNRGIKERRLLRNTRIRE